MPPAVIGAIHPNIGKGEGVSYRGTLRVVLVVEVEWAVRCLIGLQLRGGGWDVLQATTVERGHQVPATGRPR